MFFLTFNIKLNLFIPNWGKAATRAFLRKTYTMESKMQPYSDKDWLFYRHQEFKTNISKTLVSMSIVNHWINDVSVDIKSIQHATATSGRLGTQISNNARKVIIKRQSRSNEVQKELDADLDKAIVQKEIVENLAELIADESKLYSGLNEFLEGVPALPSNSELRQKGIDSINGKSTVSITKALRSFSAFKRSVLQRSKRLQEVKTSREQVQKYVAYFYSKLEKVPLSIGLVEEFKAVNNISETSDMSEEFDRIIFMNSIENSAALETCENFLAFLRFKATNTITRLKVKHADEKQKFSSLTRQLEAKRFYMNRVKSYKYWAEKLFDMEQYTTNDVDSVADLLNLAKDIGMPDFSVHFTRSCYFLFPGLNERKNQEIQNYASELKKVQSSDLKYIERTYCD